MFGHTASTSINVAAAAEHVLDSSSARPARINPTSPTIVQENTSLNAVVVAVVDVVGVVVGVVVIGMHTPPFAH